MTVEIVHAHITVLSCGFLLLSAFDYAHRANAFVYCLHTHSRTVVGTLMNKVCSGKSPCRCSWVGLKDIVTLLALSVTTENSVLRAKPEDSTGLGQSRSAAWTKAGNCYSLSLI